MQRRMIEALQAIPGVSSVGLVDDACPWEMALAARIVFTDKTTDLRPAECRRQRSDVQHLSRILPCRGHHLADRAERSPGRTTRMRRAWLWSTGSLRAELFGSVSRRTGQVFTRCKDGTRIQVVGIAEDGKYYAASPKIRSRRCFFPSCNRPRVDTVWWCAPSAIRNSWPQPSGARCASWTRDCRSTSRRWTRGWTSLCFPRMWRRCRWACWA